MNDSDFELYYPERVKSSRNILELRACKPAIKWPITESTPGHTFVFIGRGFDDGTTIFYGAHGFYPENNTLKVRDKLPG